MSRFDRGTGKTIDRIFCRAILALLLAILFTGTLAPRVSFATHVPMVEIDQLWSPLPTTGYLEYLTDPTKSRFGEEWTGWVDVRHPDGFSANSAASPYERSNRQTDIKTIIVSDNANPDVAAAPSTSRDFDHANKIYGQAGLSIIHETTGGGVNGSDTLSMDGTGGSLNIGAWGTGINQTNEDDNMKGLKRSGNATTINTYYVKDYHPNVNGLTSGPSGFGGNSPRNDGSGLATDFYVSNTAAHEWGHMLLNGTAVQHEHTTPSESADRTNLMYRTGGFAAPTLNDVGILGLHDIVTSDQAEKMFLNGGDSAPHNNPGFVQKPAAHVVDHHRYGDVVDWDFVVDHKKRTIMHTSTDTGVQVSVTVGLEDEANGLDSHKGVDDLFWGIPFFALSSPSQTGHVKTGLGTFTKLTPSDIYEGTEFRYVDVFSNALRYSDYDRDGANESTREAALDYEVTFRKADGTTAAGTPVLSFKPGWTNTSNADDYVTRWVSPFDATGVLVKANTTGSHDGTAQIDAVVASTIEHSSTGPNEGYIPATPGDPLDDFFIDVKSEQLSDSDTIDVTWSMHVRVEEEHYAGYLFDIVYDGSEITDLAISSAGVHFGMEEPGGNGGGPLHGTLPPGITLPGSQAGMTTAGAIAAWIDPGVAGASGLTLPASSFMDLVRIEGGVKNTTPVNNSDIDITLRSWRIKHVPGAPGELVPVTLAAGDFLYITPLGSGLTPGGLLPAVETGPGFGLWFPIVSTIVGSLPASGFYAVKDSLVNMGGYGIEHVPEPAGFVIILAGVGCIAIGCVRRRRLTA